MSQPEFHQIIRGGLESICPKCYHYAVCRGVDNQPCVECSHFSHVQSEPWGKWALCAHGAVRCTECGAKGRTSYKFCPQCGARMEYYV